MPKTEPVPICNICEHMLLMVEEEDGYGFFCTDKCRCTMIGCVPRTDKYKSVKRKR